MTDPKPHGITETFRPCAASTTHDLLDCDCGYLTNHMKIQLLTLLDEHTLYSLEQQLGDRQH